MDSLSLSHRDLVAQYDAANDETRDLIEYILLEQKFVTIDDGTDDWQRAAAMHKHSGIRALDSLVEDIATQWGQKMVHGMLNSRNTVDQRAIDERRGWYTGARYALRVLPYRAHRRAMKALAETPEEVGD